MMKTKFTGRNAVGSRGSVIVLPWDVFEWGRERSGRQFCAYLFIEYFAATLTLQNCTGEVLAFEGSGDSTVVSNIENSAPVSFTANLRDLMILEPYSFVSMPASQYLKEDERDCLEKGDASLDVNVLLKGQECEEEVLVLVRHDRDHFRVMPSKAQ